MLKRWPPGPNLPSLVRQRTLYVVLGRSTRDVKNFLYMRKPSSRSDSSSKPEWSARILELREQLHLNQTEFGQRLRSSAMAVSRWERGAQEPPSHSYIEIGNLAGDPGCWYFWARAGLRSEDVMKVMPGMRRRLRRAHTHDFEIVRAGSGKQKPAAKLQLVAVPLLKIAAASLGDKGDDIPFLHDAPVES